MVDYDVLVIGGGIHGVGVAQAAAAAGYRVALVEQYDLAWGTSSRSSKLIHGGLRYLENAQFPVVRECLRERAILLKIAPQLVSLTPFYIPIYRDTQRRPWQIRSGLSLYALLAGFGEGSDFHRVPRSQWSQLDGLETDGLQAVFQYWDGQTDDARLTRAVMASAEQLGAELFQPAQLIGAVLEEEGVQVTLDTALGEQQLTAQVLVNAAGPWVNRVLDLVEPAPKSLPVDLVQGTHLVIDQPLSRGIYYMEAPQDHRAVFAIPWQGKTLLGTTETPYQGDPANVAPLPQEEAYLLEVLAHYFPRMAGELKVVERFAGLRVLPREEGSAFGRSRETILLPDRSPRPRLISIYGGKLTAYRATAQKVMAELRPHLPACTSIADTASLPLQPVDE